MLLQRKRIEKLLKGLSNSIECHNSWEEAGNVNAMRFICRLVKTRLVLCRARILLYSNSYEVNLVHLDDCH